MHSRWAFATSHGHVNIIIQFIMEMVAQCSKVSGCYGYMHQSWHGRIMENSGNVIGLESDVYISKMQRKKSE